MLPPDITAWLLGNSDESYKRYLEGQQLDIRRWVSTLGIEGTELAELYTSYGSWPVRGWWELLEIDEISDWTAYAKRELGVPSGYLALTSIEGEGVVLYHRETGWVYDVKFGQFEQLQAGILKPLAYSISGYLSWCRDRASGT